MVAPRRVPLWIALLPLAIAAGARAEQCECRDTSFTWAGCDAVSGCDQSGWTSCTASPDDGYDVQSGCHVDVDPGADVLLSQLSALNRVFVAAGGSVTVRGPVEWRIGPGGFVTQPGSRVELSGCFRRFGDGGADCSDALGPDNLFAAGTILPCRDGDCSDGDADLVRLAYPEDTTGELTAAFARLDVARDVLCFWQKDEAGYVGADAGACYKLAAIGADPGAPYLDFDIRQVWNAQSDQSGYPLARRVVHEGTLLGAHAAGAAGERLLDRCGVVVQDRGRSGQPSLHRFADPGREQYRRGRQCRRGKCVGRGRFLDDGEQLQRLHHRGG